MKRYWLIYDGTGSVEGGTGLKVSMSKVLKVSRSQCLNVGPQGPRGSRGRHRGPRGSTGRATGSQGSRGRLSGSQGIKG